MLCTIWIPCAWLTSRMQKDIRGFFRLLTETIHICVVCNIHLYTVTYCTSPVNYWLPKNVFFSKFSSRLATKWFLINDQHDAQILFYVFISIYNSLHVSSTQCSSSGETNCINTASGNSHSMLVAEMCAGWKKKRMYVSHIEPHSQSECGDEGKRPPPRPLQDTAISPSWVSHSPDWSTSTSRPYQRETASSWQMRSPNV